MVEQLGGAQADEATGPTLLLMPSSSALSLYSWITCKIFAKDSVA